MEDQFGGRTDDDLFADDFEPNENENVSAAVEETPVVVPEPASVPQPTVEPLQKPDEAVAPAQLPVKRPIRGLATSRFATQVEPESAAEVKAEPPVENKPVETKPKPKPKPAAKQQPKAEVKSEPKAEVKLDPKPNTEGKTEPRKRSPRPRGAKKAQVAQNATIPAPTADSTTTAAKQPPPSTAQNATANQPKSQRPAKKVVEKPNGEKSQPNNPKPKPAAAIERDARIQSGANPRKKMTEEELTAKMEKMKLISAEKTKQFAKAEKDQKEHAEAIKRGEEEARKRRAEEAERRKAGEEQRRKLDDERAKNRERKLKSMSMKEGSWDSGKEAAAEDESRRRFRGANGGIRGNRAGGLAGLSGSRFARDSESSTPEKSSDDSSHGRGRGRGGRGRGVNGTGRGGRRGSDKLSTKSSSPLMKATTPADSNDPSLPAGDKKPTVPVKTEPAPPPIPTFESLPRFTGKWDDEMEEYDEQQKANPAQ